MRFTDQRFYLAAAVLMSAMLTAHPGSLAGQTRAAGARPGETRVVVPGAQYRANGFRRFLLGSEYRNLWLTPIEVGVLNLDSVGGGLTPVRTGGFGQSISLQFVGRDGRPYTVRSIDKDPTKRLDEELKGTFVEDVVRDQISALFPLAPLAVDPLLEATGILHSPHRLVIMPDDPRLGEFREEFAGLLGTLVEFPNEGPEGTSGFAGSRQIESSEALLGLLRQNPRDRVNAEEFLKARLVDMVIGDRDRHEGQWRWAAFPGGAGRVWRAIPEDRDQAFVDYDGLIMALSRIARPQQIRFGPGYPGTLGLTFNGWEIDRYLMAELERPAWDSLVQVVQADLTDDVIDRAAGRLPLPHYEISGAFIATALKARRDALLHAATDYYRLITKWVEVNGTDQNDRVEIEHQADGAMDLTITSAVTPGQQVRLYRRRFTPTETNEVRVYLHGGDDHVSVLGGRGAITVRVIGGPGDDHVANRSEAGASRTRFYDAEGINTFEPGRGVKVNRDPYLRPPATDLAHKYALDWGGRSTTVPFFYFNPDFGVFAGGYHEITRYGFRRSPSATRHVFNAGVATRVFTPRLFYDGRYYGVGKSLDGTLGVTVSGLEVLRFYGFGNETTGAASSSFFDVEQQQLAVEPMLRWAPGKTFGLGLGPVFRTVSTDNDTAEPSFIANSNPYGTGTFSQLGVQGDLTFDTRDQPGHARKGVHITAGASFYPEFLDVEATFGEVHGSAATFLTADVPTSPSLALRAGGKKIWGRFPYYEAAFLGGGEMLRGFRNQRYAGDASVYGTAELRLDLMQLAFLVPGRFGVFGFGDAGRVFFENDPPGADRLHTGVGGGIWMSFFQRQYTFSAAVADGGDLTGLYVRTGFMF